MSETAIGLDTKSLIAMLTKGREQVKNGEVVSDTKSIRKKGEGE